MKRLAPAVTISDCPSEVFCTKFSPDGKFLAAGCGDGAIRVFNTKNGSLSYTLMQPHHNYGFGMPCTAIRFRPMTDSTKTKNVLLAVNSNGSVEHWHITSGKCLHAISDEENQLYSLDYSSDGTMFATGGKDHVVRVYDEATKTKILSMEGGKGQESAGHSNRIFSLKFYDNDPNIILSGGWDNTVQIWDMRERQAVRYIYGPHLAGDALDISNDKILTGSWRSDDPLELWDYGSGKRITSITWSQSNSTLRSEPCFLYSAQFSKGINLNTQLIAAGGSGTNEAKVFDHSKGNKLIGTIGGLSRGVFTLDFNSAGSQLAVAGADAAIRIIDIYDSKEESLNDRPSTPSIRNEINNIRTGSPTNSRRLSVEKAPPSPTKRIRK